MTRAINKKGLFFDGHDQNGSFIGPRLVPLPMTSVKKQEGVRENLKVQPEMLDDIACVYVFAYVLADAFVFWLCLRCI